MNRAYLFAAGAAAALLAGLATPAHAADTVTFAGWGGVTQEATIKGLLSPAQSLGITVRSELHGGLPGLRAHVAGGRVTWDLVHYGFSDCERAAQDGLLEPLDYAKIDMTDIDPKYKFPTYVGSFSFSYGVGYNSKKFAQKPPRTWADFWDTKTYPGRRSLFNIGLYVLEAALMADGVPMAQVYPMLDTPAGVDRAFKKLEEIKPHVAVWWTSSGQAMQLIKDGEVDLIMIANGRAEALIKDGADVGFSWDQALIEDECWAIPKGSANKDAATRLISASLRPEPQARFGTMIEYGPVNPKAYTLGILSPQQTAKLPTAPANIDKQLQVSPTFYASANGRQAVERFTRFIQKN